MFIREPGEILGLRGTLQRDGKGVRTYSAQACEVSRILSVPAQNFRSYLEKRCQQRARLGQATDAELRVEPFLKK